MADYKHAEDGVIRLSDGAAIPNDMGNRDWVEYQEYVAGGGATDPARTDAEIQAMNKSAAEQAQEKIIVMFSEDAERVTLGLPPKMSDDQSKRLKALLLTLQNDIDNPSTDPNYQPAA